MRRLTLLLIALVPAAAHAQLTLTSDFGTLTITDSGALQSLATREEPPYELLRHPLDLCVLQGEVRPQSARLLGDRAALDFGPQHGRLTIRAIAQPWGFVLEIVEAAGPALRDATFFRAPIKTQAEFFPPISLCRSPERAFCLVPGSAQTRLNCSVQAEYQYGYHAVAPVDTGVVGAKVGLVVAKPQEFRSALAQAWRHFGFVVVPPADEEIAQSNCLVLDELAAGEAAGAAEIARAMGARTVFFPPGEGAAQACRALRDAGLMPGLVVRRPPLVARVTEAVKRLPPAKLARPANRVIKRLFTEAIPEGYPAQNGLLLVGDELIRYRRLVAEEPFGFVQLARGAFGTPRREHAAGAEVVGLQVTTTPGIGYIPELHDPMLNEHASEIAAAYRTAGFGALHFVRTSARDDTQALAFQPAVIQALPEPPSLVQTERFSPLLWPHTGRAVAAAPGWGGPLPGVGVLESASAKDDESPLPLSKALPLLARSVGAGAPAGLRGRLRDLVGHPRRADLCLALSAAQRMRRDGSPVPETWADEKKTHLLIAREEGPHVAAATPLPDLPAGLAAYALDAADGAQVAYWHETKQGFLHLPLAPPAQVSFPDQDIPQRDGHAVLPLGSVRVAHVHGADAEAVQQAFAQARLVLGNHVWLPAERYVRLEGEMGLASEHGVEDAEAWGDFIITLKPSAIDDRRPWFAEYEATLPHPGEWHLWARVRYKDANLNSFSLAAGDGENTGEPFGNDAVYGPWYWDGGIALRAETTRLRFRIYEREAGPPAEGPRLDALCLCDDPGYRPADQDARAPRF